MDYNIFSVYVHTTPDNKRYIGITQRDPKERWNRGSGYFNNKRFHDAIIKHGWDNIRHEIVFSDLTLEEAKEREKKLIDAFDTTNPEHGYNKTKGGGGYSGPIAHRSVPNNYKYEDHHPVVACMCEETKRHFRSITEAAKEMGLHPSSVSGSCRTNGKASAGGYHFIYTDQDRVLRIAMEESLNWEWEW